MSIFNDQMMVCYDITTRELNDDGNYENELKQVSFAEKFESKLQAKLDTVFDNFYSLKWLGDSVML
jgi:hypothetical protein